jgi:hypothetical protein
MPRIIRTFEDRHPRHKMLVKRLIQEFTTPGTDLQPLILEERTPQTRTRHIYVIWEKLVDLSFEQRFDLIMDAYRQVEGEAAAELVLSATGLTAVEALAHGLLPYLLVPNRRKGDKHSPQDYSCAMAKEAKHTLLGADAKELRYASLEDAEQARERLKANLPGSAWRIKHEQGVED